MSKIAIRSQLVFAIYRKGQYWTGGAGWHENIMLAKIMPKRQQIKAVKVDIGLSGCELIEIVPIRNELHKETV